MNDRVERVRAARRRMASEGPARTRAGKVDDFAVVALDGQDCDVVRDLLIEEQVSTIVEVGLAYGGSALAIGEALLTVGDPDARHLVIDPFQHEAFDDVGWEAMVEAGLGSIATLVREESSAALPQMVRDGLVADAAFIDGSHRFHEVFVDLYFLRRIMRPGGLLLMDDAWAPSVRTAVRYFEENLDWAEIPEAFARGTFWTRVDPPVRRCRAIRLPTTLTEPAFETFRPFTDLPRSG
ncbi:class I SAM-dependent methyltransferase [Catenuloplanes sp. NPDC051500]|uniref:class I SAM-dependent methyltransferase n=1 Tax=Catenuloplanes sp. NPDC051500 TaxID=3363959 RepID=UPI0037880B49